MADTNRYHSKTSFWMGDSWGEGNITLEWDHAHAAPVPADTAKAVAGARAWQLVRVLFPGREPEEILHTVEIIPLAMNIETSGSDLANVGG